MWVGVRSVCVCVCMFSYVTVRVSVCVKGVSRCGGGLSFIKVSDIISLDKERGPPAESNSLVEFRMGHRQPVKYKTYQFEWAAAT